MTPQTQCCHNTHCPARGQHRQGNIHVHSRAEQRYRCSQCGRTFLVGRRVWMAMAMAVPARLWLGVPSAPTATKRYSQRLNTTFRASLAPLGRGGGPLRTPRPS
jgi:hypothetical protein